MRLPHLSAKLRCPLLWLLLRLSKPPRVPVQPTRHRHPQGRSGTRFTQAWQVNACRNKVSACRQAHSFTWGGVGIAWHCVRHKDCRPACFTSDLDRCCPRSRPGPYGRDKQTTKNGRNGRNAPLQPSLLFLSIEFLNTAIHSSHSVEKACGK